MLPVHADLRPVQAGGPPIWIGGASEAAMRRVRRAAQDAARDPDALKTAMRINLEPGPSVDSLAGKLARFAGSGWMKRSWMPAGRGDEQQVRLVPS